MNKYIAELTGAFSLTLAVIVSLGGTILLPTPVVAALTVGLFVYTVGAISGAHLNPAVTIGLWSLGKISSKDTVIYFIVQFFGAALAMFAGKFLVTPAVLSVASTPAVFIAEGIGTFFLAFGIASVVYGKAPSYASGIVIGGSLLLGVSLASILSNGVLNPAVALGIGSFSWLYLLGPILGSLAGMWTFAYLAGEIGSIKSFSR